MTFAEHSCVTVTCDGCGDGWSDDYGPIHFTSEDDARDWLGKNDWMVSPARVLCSGCAEDADCAVTGHQRCEWEDRVWEGVGFRRRHCSHCSLVEYDPPFEELSDLLHVARTINGLSAEETK